MNKALLDLLPSLLEKLSRGEVINISELSRKHNIPHKTIQDNIKKYLETIDFAEIHFEKTLNGWVAKKNFLSETQLSPKEIITIQILKQCATKYGDEFLKTTQRMFNKLNQRASLSIFRKTNIERIKRDDEKKIAMITNAIKENRIISCIYKGKKRLIYPLRIVLLERYWYLLLWDPEKPENERLRKYHLKSIQQIELQDETFEVPKSRAIAHLDNAINAFFKDETPFDVVLIVHKKVIQYFERSALQPKQRISSAPEYGENYYKLELQITDPMEIIPTIQQYLPYIKVEAPTFLNELILQNISNYEHFELPEE